MGLARSELHKETVFEDHFILNLVNEHGYIERDDSKNYDKSLALDVDVVLEFVRKTQAAEWTSFERGLGLKAKEFFVKELERRLKSDGTLSVLKQGLMFTNGTAFSMCYFRPPSKKIPQREVEYKSNILSVIRQLHYSTKNNKSIDLVLFLNGIPVVTVELKNDASGQTVDDAMAQYRKDRKPSGEPLLTPFRGAIVHFAVDTDMAFMTTLLRNGKTKFLPFNRGNGGHEGNSPVGNEFPVAHLYTAVDGTRALFSREVLLDVIGKFVQEDKGALIFPRYHQLAAVSKIATHASVAGAGQDYLIQHSAGSGKTWTIAWTADMLSKLHSDDDSNIFDTVVIVSDRRVLDDQLRKAIRKLGLSGSYFETVENGSRQLKEALEAGKKIVVTTIQKFCTSIISEMAEMSGRRFAVIVDEAHGTQSGKAAEGLHRSLSKGNDKDSNDDWLDISDAVALAAAKSQAERGRSNNISYIAFTATPRQVTLERFGTREEKYETPHPFHAYSMRQAIEEGFILNVLQNYTTYKSYYELEKATEKDPRFNNKKAVRKIAKYVSLSTIHHKAAVIVDHFRVHVQSNIGGAAKAMIVTQSREHAYRHYQAIKAYIQSQGYTDLNALVAFSGELQVDGEATTEHQLNGFSETELPSRFDGNEFQVLIVANKYQTGFDQPKLCAMYIDRKLRGVQCVQTLCRANRVYEGKDEDSIHILDFENSLDDIREAFSPYVDVTTLDGISDPNQIYDLKRKIIQAAVVSDEAVWDFAIVYGATVDFKPSDKARLESLMSHSFANYRRLPAAEKDEFRQAVKSYCRFYTFISKAYDIADVELEKWFWYLEWFAKKLSVERKKSDSDLTDDLIAIRKFRLEEKEKGDATPSEQEATSIAAISRFGINAPSLAEEERELSVIIHYFNEKYHTQFSEDDVARYAHHASEFSRSAENRPWIVGNPDDVIIDKFSEDLLDYLADKASHERDIDNVLMTDLETWKRLAYILLRANKRVLMASTLV